MVAFGDDVIDLAVMVGERSRQLVDEPLHPLRTTVITAGVVAVARCEQLVGDIEGALVEQLVEHPPGGGLVAFLVCMSVLTSRLACRYLENDRSLWKGVPCRV